MSALSQVLEPEICCATHMVVRYTVPCTVPQAINFLADYWEPCKLMALYQHYFPAEFAASALSAHRPARGVYTQAELEFFRLVSERLFPLEEIWLDEAEGRFDVIPVTPHGLEWVESDPADFRPGWQLLLRLYMTCLGEWNEGEDGDPGPNASPEVPSEIQEDLAALLPKGGAVTLDWRKLSDLCRTGRVAEPLRHLSLCFDVIGHDTGCVWLDADSYYHTIHAVWDRENIDWLTTEWAECLQKSEGVNALIEWLEESPGNMRQAVKLWCQCAEGLNPDGLERLAHVRPQARTRRRRPKTLVEVFAQEREETISYGN